MKRLLLIFATLAVVLAMPLVAAAHNAGHLFLPDGTCLEIGSFKDAPLVGQDRTRLDLAPETPYPPYDEIGVSWVGHLQLSNILPGRCPATVSTTSTGTSTSSNTATVKPDTRAKSDAAGKTNRGKK